MEKSYKILGMTCGGCVAKVKKTLEAIPEVGSAKVQLEAPEGVLSIKKEVSIELLNSKLSAVGNYTIEEITPESNNEIELPDPSLAASPSMSAPN